LGELIQKLVGNLPPQLIERPLIGKGKSLLSILKTPLQTFRALTETWDFLGSKEESILVMFHFGQRQT
jgi:hypothetical protein